MPDPSAILATSISVPVSLLDPAGRPEWLRATPPSIWLQPGPPHVPENRTDRFLQAFDVAINPWQAGNYAESASRLALVAGEYPTSADVHFYLGAAWLLAGTPGEAVVPLARAVELADTDERARDARWYLGLAALGAGLYGPALGAFGSGCARGHGVACDAAELLKTHSDEPS